MAFVNKLNDSEAEAVESPVWLQYTVDCGYLDRDTRRELYIEYDNIIGKLVNIINKSQDWVIG